MARKVKPAKAGAEFKIDPELFERVKMFKKVYDAVVEQEAPWEEYLNCLVAFGLERMMRDAVPQGEEWNTLKGLVEENPDLLFRFIAEAWQKRRDKKKEEGSPLREDIERVRSYIG